MSHSRPVEIVNMYESLPAQFKNPIVTYPNYKKMKIDIPCNIGVVAMTGAGKTNWTLQLIKLIGIFKKIYIFSASLEEPLYRYTIDYFAKLTKKLKLKEPILYYSEDVSDIPTLDNLERCQGQTLIIWDDLITQRSAVLKQVSEYFVRGRKLGLTNVFLSQKYTAIPILIRAQFQYITLLKIGSKADVKRLLQEHNLGVDIDTLLTLYKQCTTQGMKTTFMIDLKTNDKDLRFRCNFQGIHLPSDED